MEMYTKYEEQVAFFFDRCPTREQIRSLAKMYSVPQADIINILKMMGREIPEKTKAPIKSAGLEPVKMSKIPDCVNDTITKRISELEEDIKNYQDMVNRLEAEYTAHVNFLMGVPFEQGNLSHGSDNIVESPQPKG